MSALSGTSTVGLVVGAHKTTPLELFGIGGTCRVMEVGSLAGTDIDVWIFPEIYPTSYIPKFEIEFNSLNNQFETSINGIDLLLRPSAGNSKVHVADISALRVVKGAALGQPAWSMETVSWMKQNFKPRQRT
jgi:hypothetical protein